MDEIVVGIDLGTTFSAVAYVDDTGRPKILPNADGKGSTPSVVLVQNGKISVGDAPLNQWVTNQEHVVRWIKRAMGDPEYRFQGLSAVQLSAEILKALKCDAEVEIGAPLKKAVITCPAYFAAIEIEGTKEAGELAGFEVQRIVEEPTAAAVYFGVEHMHDGETILVCDLGGGTFDATVLSFEGGAFVPRTSMGDRKLGGHDWTMELVAMVAQRFQDQFGDDPQNDVVAGQLLYEACEKAKRDFARLNSVTIPCQFQERIEEFDVSRDAFEQQTESLTYQVVMWSERSLEKASLDWSNVGRILLVGGSSRLRRVKLALQEAAGIEPTQIRDPDLAVAYGAAIMARGAVRPRQGLVEVSRGGLQDASSGGLLEVVAKTSQTRNLGTRVVKRDDGPARVVSAKIIPYGVELPVKRSRDDFEITSATGEHIEIPVVEFEDAEDDDYEFVGNFLCKVPPTAQPGDRIQVSFSYDISRIPTVEAVDLKSGANLQIERIRDYTDPSPEQLVVKPRWVVFSVDVSYSMNGNKLDQAKRAVIDNARQLLGVEHCMVAVVSFGSSAHTVCSPTSDSDQLETAVSMLGPTGSTAMDEGIRQAINVLEAAPADADRDIVMLTDGMPDSTQATLAAADDTRARGITLSSLGVSESSGDVDEDFLKALTPLTLKISDPNQISAGFAKLLGMSAQLRQGGLLDH